MDSFTCPYIKLAEDHKHIYDGKYDIAMCVLAPIISLKYGVKIEEATKIVNETKAQEIYWLLASQKIYPPMVVFATFIYDTYIAQK